MSAKTGHGIDHGRPFLSKSIIADIDAMFELSSRLEKDSHVYELSSTLGSSDSTTSLRTLRDPSLLSTGNNSIVDAFLSDDNGLPLLNGLKRSTSASRPPISSGFKLSRIRSAPSPTSGGTSSKSSTRSSLLHPLTEPAITLPLAAFCDLIDAHNAIERIQIVSVEIHKEWSNFGGNLHRFLLMHLRRPARADIFVRLDRRTSLPSALLPKLIRSRAKLAAVDTVTFASAKSDLVRSQKAKVENRLILEEPSNLRTFRFFVTIICEELRSYHVWPENSWQLCTLMQEYLASASRSEFVLGSPLYFGLTKDIRTRIYNRIYHVPQGSTMFQLFQCVTLPANSYWKETYLPKALLIAKEFDSTFHSHHSTTVPDQTVIDTSEILRVLACQTLDPNEGALLASRASALYRQLASYDPERHNERFIAALNTHADRLVSAKRWEDACAVLREVVGLYLKKYEDAPRGSLNKLANALRAYAKYVPRVPPRSPKPHQNHLLPHIPSLPIASAYTSSTPSSSSTSSRSLSSSPFTDLLDTYAELYKRDPDKWHIELNDTLSTCIDSTLKLPNRAAEGIKASVRFVELYRVRYDASPRAHWAPFVDALQALVERLFRVKRTSDAGAEHLELMRVYRTLWRSHEHEGRVPRDKLARSMEAYAQRVFRVKRYDEGIVALREIVEMYRAAYIRDGHDSRIRHHTSLAEALDGLSDGLASAGRVLEACGPSEDVVEMYRRHLDEDDGGDAEAFPFHAALAKALVRHSVRLKKAGKDAESWAMRVEIVDMYRDLDRVEPGLYHREFASALNACADQLVSSGRYADACAASLEIVEYYRAVSGTSHAGFAELTRSLTSYADRLERAEEFDKACEAIGEIVALDRRLYARYPTAHSWAMAGSLDALAVRLARAGRIHEACDTAREAVDIDREHGTYERPSEAEETKRACFLRVARCCEYMIQLEMYLETLDLAGWTLEALKVLRSHYDYDEQQSAERVWMKEEERKLRKLVKEMLQACNRERIRIPSQQQQTYLVSTNSTDTLDKPPRPRRNSTNTRRPKLGWEIHRYRSERRADGRRVL